MWAILSSFSSAAARWPNASVSVSLGRSTFSKFKIATSGLSIVRDRRRHTPSCGDFFGLKQGVFHAFSVRNIAQDR